ncbi:hypothetical protein OsJ_28068 [Oryza sativa Japonica Group]|uniref:ACT domain-containing protein ACR n=1 Tax=Oryza sativa subsp. japonica TaxID=39947 RepID=A3BV73_ORYSJ|nr:hypothetical protein OsJ_28068 [Oryza sativa Japonica Group]
MARSGGELVVVEEDDEYAKLVRRMNPPSVVIDNDSCDSATVIRVDRVKKHGILLEAVQVLVDLNLVITKAYISSDGNWFMDVFNVTDQDGNKVQNKEVTDCIKKCLESEDYLVLPASSPAGGAAPSEETTCIELTGTDRPGLLSEVCAVLASLRCNIVNAEVWTHDRRAAAVIQITDEATGLPVRDGGRLSQLQELLGNVMQGDGDGGGDSRKGSTAVSLGAANAERRLHRLMLDDGDAGRCGEERGGVAAAKAKAKVVVMDCTERRYTVVILRCRDRPRLLFDTLSPLTDLHYVVFHGTGLELEVKTEDRAGLLSEITRVFRENSLSIIRAVITTKDGEADDTFYVSDAYGNPVDGKAMEALGEQLGHAVLRVKSNGRAAINRAEDSGGGGAAAIIGNLLKGSFQGFRLIRSYS